MNEVVRSRDRRFGYRGVAARLGCAVLFLLASCAAQPTAPPTPTVAAPPASVAVSTPARGCLYVFGGEGNDAHPRGLFPQNEVYNPQTDSWQRLEPIPTPVHGVTGAAYLDDWIHLAGGVARGGNSGSTVHQVFRAVVDCEAGAPPAPPPRPGTP